MRPQRIKHKKHSISRFTEKEKLRLHDVIEALLEEADEQEKEEQRSALTVRRIQNPNVVAPDGYLPNSAIRQDVHLHTFRPHVEQGRKRETAVFDVDLLGSVHPCLERYRNADAKNVDFEKERYRTAKQEAKRFKQLAIYGESKKVSKIFSEAMEKHATETALLKFKNLTTRKRNVYRLNRKLHMLKVRKELTNYARQQIVEMQHSISQKGVRLSRPVPSGEPRVNRRLTTIQFDEITEKLIGNLGSRSQLYDLAQQVLQDDPENPGARSALADILGSNAQVLQYLLAFKQPDSMIAYLTDRLGGIKQAFKFIDRALVADLWSIYKISKTIGYDTKAAIRFLRGIEKTLAAAANCLTTKSSNFHYVQNFLELLMKREWSKADLIDLANGRYVESLKPGEKPNKNPLITTATKMSEEAFLQFFAHLKRCDYRYFQQLGNIHYEQPSDKLLLRYKIEGEMMIQYSEILEGIESEENRNLLRPPPDVLRELAGAMLGINASKGLPEYIGNLYAKLASMHVILLSSEILLEVRNGRTAIESLSVLINTFLSVFGDICFHVKRIIEGHLPDSEIYDILVKSVQGDQDECYRLKTLVDEHLAGYLTKVLQVIYGKVVSSIMRYSLLSSHAAEINVLLDNCLDMNTDSPAEPLIESWLILKNLSFDLASSLDISPQIPDLHSLIRQTNFFIEAGCKGVVTIPPPPSEADQQARRLRSIYMPIRARVTRRAEVKSPILPFLQTGRRTAIRQMWTGPEPSANTRLSSQSMDSSEEDFLEREAEIYSGIKGRRREYDNLDDSDSEAISGGAFYSKRSQVAQAASTMESLAEQLKNLSGEAIKNQPIPVDMMECIDEGWGNLVELQAVRQLVGSKEWDAQRAISLSKGLYYALVKFLSKMAKMLGENMDDMRRPSIFENIQEYMMDSETLTKSLWQDLSVLKSKGVFKAVRETYEKFKLYVDYLKRELSDEIDFLYEVENEMTGITMLEPLMIAPIKTLFERKPANMNLSRFELTKSARVSQTLRSTLNSLKPRSESSSEGSDDSFKKKHVQFVTTKSDGAIGAKRKQKREMFTNKMLKQKFREATAVAGFDSKSAESAAANDTTSDFTVIGKGVGPGRKESLRSSDSPNQWTPSVKALPSLSIATTSTLGYGQGKKSSKGYISPPKTDRGVSMAIRQSKYRDEYEEIIKRAFPNDKKSVSSAKFYKSWSEMAQTIQIARDYNREVSERIASNVFTLGSIGWSAERLSTVLKEALEDQEKNESEMIDSDSSLMIGLRSTRLDNLIDWIELLQTDTDPNVEVKESFEGASTSSCSSFDGVWAVQDNIPQLKRMSSVAPITRRESFDSIVLLPPLPWDNTPSPVQSVLIQSQMVEQATEKLHSGATATEDTFDPDTSKLSSTPSSPGSLSGNWKASKLPTPTSSSKRLSSSSSEFTGDWRTRRAHEESLSLTHSISRNMTSSVGTWAYSTSTEVPSSEFSDRVLTDEDADLENRRPAQKKSMAHSLRVSPHEIAEHIAKVLQSITGLADESIFVIREMLKIIANKTAAVHKLNSLLDKRLIETSIFWNDDAASLRLMNVFLDIIMLTVTLMLDYLPENTFSRVFNQVNRDVTNILQTLSQLGTVTLADEDEAKMLDALSMLNSANLVLTDELLSNKPSKARLRDGRNRVFRTLDLKRIFRLPTMIGLGVRSSKYLQNFYLPPIGASPSSSSKSSSTKSSKANKKDSKSAFLIAKTVFPLLPAQIVAVAEKISAQRQYDRILERMDIRLQRRLRLGQHGQNAGNKRDIMKILTAVMQQSKQVTKRANRRLQRLGIERVDTENTTTIDVSSIVRVVNRPSWIKPHDWGRIAGKTGLAAVRVGNTTLCHRGEEKSLGHLIKVDKESDLSHHMVSNYDIAHVINRHSLAQLAELCGAS